MGLWCEGSLGVCIISSTSSAMENELGDNRFNRERCGEEDGSSCGEGGSIATSLHTLLRTVFTHVYSKKHQLQAVL